MKLIMKSDNGNNDDYRGEKEDDFERIEHWSV